MSVVKNCFIPFKQDVSGIELPRKFTYPFYYTPHRLSTLAADELQAYIRAQPWNSSFESGDTEGIMFGVLVVKNATGQLGYLAAFSGKLNGSNHHTSFVPPVYDILTPDGFFRQEEERISQLNREIDTLEFSDELREAAARYHTFKEETEKELALARKNIKKGKKERKNQRAEAQTRLSATQMAELESSLVKESMDDQFAYKRLVKERRLQLEVLHNALNSLNGRLADLKAERKSRSGALQSEIFEKYQFLNGQGKPKSLLAIFENHTERLPPAGAGECAAPKLLQFAYLNKLEPISLAEFWWGKAPSSEIRVHRNFYPSCRGKCEPILGHMLQGLDVEDNQMLLNLAKEKELDIIFNDEHLLAVNKPHDFLSVPGKNIEDSVITRIKAKYPEADGPMVVHRLDMGTSGIMLLAKSKEIHRLLQHQFENRTIKKRYVAILDGELKEEQGEINLPLAVDYADRPRQLVCHERGKPSKTIWKRVEISNGKTRIHFFPITGRTHQLRVHSAHAQGLNTPIYGDELYGTKAHRLHLHAASIEFEHPVTKQCIKLKTRDPF